MVDPSGDASHVLKALKPERNRIIVEPFANESGRIFKLLRVFYAHLAWQRASIAGL